MADLSDLQSALTIKIAGAGPSTGIESNFLDVDANGRPTVNLAGTGLSPASPTAVSAGISSASLVAANSARKGLIITNTSIAKVSLGLGVAAVLNSGITLYPGGAWVMGPLTFTTGAINVIASLAASNVGVQEFS